MKIFCWLTIAQGGYYMITGIWPLVDIDTFMMVTGPKEDIWLVKTVGALVIPIGLVLLLACRRKEPLVQTAVLAIASAVAFTVIDIVYSLNDTIRDVYLIDAALQLIFIAGWLSFIFSGHNKVNKGKEYV
jgi:hypothetical protein